MTVASYNNCGVEVVKLLLENSNININQTNNNGQTALMKASCYDCEKIVELLSEHPDMNDIIYFTNCVN